MLFAKDFKTAVAVVIAVAGLLGFGTVNAGALLSEDGNGEAGTVPAFFAAELYPALLTSGSRNGAEVIATSSNAHKIYAEVGDLNADGDGGGVDIALLDGDRYFVRLDLSGGAQFGGGFAGATNPVKVRYGPDTGMLKTRMQRVRSGGAGDDHGIWTFTVDNSSSDDDSDGGTDTVVDGLRQAGAWTVEVDGLRYNGIRLPRNASATERNCYDLKFRLYDSSTEARNAGEAMIEASGTLLCLVPTVSAKVAGAQTLTASVAEGFRRFTGDSPTSGRLATATVTVSKMMACGSACPSAQSRKMIPVQPPGNTDVFENDDVLESVDVSLTGSFSHSTPFGFGEFKLGTTTMDRLDDDDEPISSEANKTAEGKAMTAKVMGTVTEPGTFHISVDVSGNNASSDTNVYEAIGQGTYKAAWDIDIVGDATPDGGSDVTAGTIMRDGTSVRIGYLQTITSLERNGDTVGWNQRLIITNHGSIASDVTLGDFKAEGGAEVMCKAADMDNPLHMMDGEPMWTCNDDGDTVMTTIGANSQLVLRVADIIEGAKRTAGTITIAQDDSQISIASSHVTLPGGQTDTVRYWPLQ